MQNEAQKPHIDDPVKKVTKKTYFAGRSFMLGPKVPCLSLGHYGPIF